MRLAGDSVHDSVTIMESSPNPLLRTILLPASAALLALGLGIVVGVRSASRSKPSGEDAIDRAMLAELAGQVRAFAAPSDKAGETPVRSVEAIVREDGARATFGDPVERSAALVSLSRAEYPRLMAEVGALDSGEVRSQWSGFAMAHWLSADPARAVGWLSGSLNEPSSAGAVAETKRWAAEQPESALVALVAQPPGALRRSVADVLAPELVRLGPGEVSRLLEALPPSAAGDEARREVLRHWVTSEPEVAFKHATERIPRAGMVEAAAELFHEWWSRDARASARALGRSTAHEALLRELVKRVPRDALPSFARGLVRAWSDELSSGEREAPAAHALASIAALSPLAATDALAEIGDGFERARIAARAVQILSARDILAAAAIALAIPGGEPRQSALRSVGAAMARTDPEGAVRWALGLEDGSARDAALQAVFFAVTSVNPRESARLAELLPEGREREAVYVSIATAWSATDPDAVGKWLETCPQGRERDAAASVFVKRVVSQRMDLAVSWSRLIADAARRHEAIEAVGYVWLARDRPRAERWLAASDLPETRLQLLLRTVRPEANVGADL